MHSLEIIAYYHPSSKISELAFKLYQAMVKNLHLNIENHIECELRLTEDRIAIGTVVS